MKRSHILRSQGQVILEFTFCFVILMLLIYGCIMAFRWAGLSLVERRIAHDETITGDVNKKWDFYSESPANQVNPSFFKGTKMNLVFNQWVED